eukprot:1258099-Pyramimonas_sp.AAC.1
MATMRMRKTRTITTVKPLLSTETILALLYPPPVLHLLLLLLLFFLLSSPLSSSPCCPGMGRARQWPPRRLLRCSDEALSDGHPLLKRRLRRATSSVPLPSAGGSRDGSRRDEPPSCSEATSG